MVEVLYEDNHLLVVNKPAGLPTMGAVGKPCLIDIAKEYIRRKYNKPGNVYLGTVSRLDAPVTGVVLFRPHLQGGPRGWQDSFRERQVDKTYWAIVQGAAPAQSVACVDWLRKGRTPPPDAHLCLWRRRCARGEIELSRSPSPGTTIRWSKSGWRPDANIKLRVQLAKRGHPVIGDRKYNGPAGFPVGNRLARPPPGS